MKFFPIILVIVNFSSILTHSEKCRFDDISPDLCKFIVTEYLSPSDYQQLKGLNRFFYRLIRHLEANRTDIIMKFPIINQILGINDFESIDELRVVAYEQADWREPVSLMKVLTAIMKSRKELVNLTANFLCFLNRCERINDHRYFPTSEHFKAFVALSIFPCHKYLGRNSRIVGLCADLINCPQYPSTLPLSYRSKAGAFELEIIQNQLGVDERAFDSELQRLKITIQTIRRKIFGRLILIFALFLTATNCLVITGQDSTILSVLFILISVTQLIVLISCGDMISSLCMDCFYKLN